MCVSGFERISDSHVFSQFPKKLESCMFSRMKTVEIPLFSCSNRVFARIFVRGAIPRYPHSVGLDRGPF
jgi:hypothetical protein